MRYTKILILLLLLPLFSASTDHKFYVSITKIEYASEKNSLQVITKIFTDDIENGLRQQYGPSISLGTKKETEKDRKMLKDYILKNLKISVNGQALTLHYLGQEYETDMVNSYIEVSSLKPFKSLEVENKILFEMYGDQQNIIHLKTPTTRRSLILERDSPSGVLNFE